MTFESVVRNIVGILDGVVIAIMALALVAFLYGLVGYIANAGSEEKRRESIKYIIGGIIGLFIMVSLWGIIDVLGSSFWVDIGIPQLR